MSTDTTGSVWAVTYAYGASDDELARVRSTHRAYLAGLSELEISGPWDEGRGALLIFRAADRAAVQSLVDADPFVSEGLVAEVGIHAWSPVLGRLLDAF